MSSENCQDFEVKYINDAHVSVCTYVCACVFICIGGQEVMACNGH